MDAWIASAIEGAERKVMRRELALLPKHVRENVVFIDLNGKAYANRAQLKNLKVYQSTAKADTYRSARGEQATFPSHLPAQTADPFPRQMNPNLLTRCLGGTGAYRRTYTKEGGLQTPIHYTYIAAAFSVRGADERTIKITDPDKDVAFAFLGGNGTNGWWLDAGLQYSPLKKDWALFIRDRGKALKSQDEGLELKQRFAPEQTIRVEMFVPQKPVLGAQQPVDNRVAVIARGRQRDNGGVRGRQQTRTYIIAVPGGWPRDGFDNGHGINLRHTVSIAQKDAPNFSTGSYFKGTTVSNVMVGSSYATRRPLRNSDVTQRCAYPNGGVVQTKGPTTDIIYDPGQWLR